MIREAKDVRDPESFNKWAFSAKARHLVDKEPANVKHQPF
jgi:hypothetical protein